MGTMKVKTLVVIAVVIAALWWIKNVSGNPDAFA
jgi:hypothetical protein